MNYKNTLDIIKQQVFNIWYFDAIIYSIAYYNIATLNGRENYANWTPYLLLYFFTFHLL